MTEDYIAFSAPQSAGAERGPKSRLSSSNTLNLFDDDEGDDDEVQIIETKQLSSSQKKSSMNYYNDDSHTLLNSMIPPWISDRSKYSLERKAPSLVRLHNEILQFCQFISPTKQEVLVRNKVIEEVKKVVMAFWPQAKMHIFGSQLTSILLPSSDIDIAILNVPIAENETVVDAIKSLADHIRKCVSVTYIEAIVNARVPIIKYDHAESKLSVDICVNHDSGLRTGEFIKNASEQYPPLRPLTLVLKTFLGQRKLNDTYTGGIGSFLISSMVLSFLQHKQKTSFFSDLYPTWNLGALLLEFFYLYGASFNYYHTGISLRDDGKYFPKYTFNDDQYHQASINAAASSSKNGRKRKFDDYNNNSNSNNNTPSNNKERPGLFCVENPDAPDQDVGRNSYQLPKIKRSFEHAYQLLTVALNDPKQISFLCYVLRSNDPLFKVRILDM